METCTSGFCICNRWGLFTHANYAFKFRRWSYIRHHAAFRRRGKNGHSILAFGFLYLRNEQCGVEDKPGNDVLYTKCVASSLRATPVCGHRSRRLLFPEFQAKGRSCSCICFLSYIGARRDNPNRCLSARRKGQT